MFGTFGLVQAIDTILVCWLKVEPESNLNIQKRSKIRKNGISDGESSGILDGEVLSAFLELDDATAYLIMKNMRFSNLPELSEMKAVIRLYERDQIALTN